MLVYALGQAPGAATTSSLLIVGSTSLIALVPHARAGHVRFREGLLFGVLGTAGSIAGSAASAAVAPQLLLSAFAALLLMVAVSMLRRAGTPRCDSEDTASPSNSASRARWSPAQAAKVLATATLVGSVTGFFGVGGGLLLVPALVLVLRNPMPVAVGTSLLVIAVNSATALAARVQGATGTGALDWALLGGSPARPSPAASSAATSPPEPTLFTSPEPSRPCSSSWPSTRPPAVPLPCSRSVAEEDRRCLLGVAPYPRPGLPPSSATRRGDGPFPVRAPWSWVRCRTRSAASSASP